MNTEFIDNAKQIIEVNDLSEPELSIYTKYSEGQLFHYFEPAPGIFICESPKVISRAFDAGYEPLSFLVEDIQLQNEEVQILFHRHPQVPIYTAPGDILKSMTGFALTRGLLCAMQRKELPDAKSLIANARRIAILEDVVNPTNVGAIFRSAAALHMDAILLTPACSDPLYRRSARVSMGTVFQAPWTILPSGPNDDPKKHYLTLLKEANFKTVSFALRKDSISIDDPLLASEEKLAIIVGTEGEGLSDSTLDSCDYTVKIPMSHDVDSLNVAAASAIAFYVLGK